MVSTSSDKTKRTTNWEDGRAGRAYLMNVGTTGLEGGGMMLRTLAFGN
jgi:hypothetical protein